MISIELLCKNSEYFFPFLIGTAWLAALIKMILMQIYFRKIKEQSSVEYKKLLGYRKDSWLDRGNYLTDGPITINLYKYIYSGNANWLIGKNKHAFFKLLLLTIIVCFALVFCNLLAQIYCS